MEELAHKKCTPCSKGTPPLKREEIKKLRTQLSKDWLVIDEKRLEKEYRFKDFRQALDFTNEVGLIAEVEGHHPDIYLSWGKVKIILWTHKIDGLSESDFILVSNCINS